MSGRFLMLLNQVKGIDEQRAGPHLLVWVFTKAKVQRALQQADDFRRVRAAATAVRDHPVLSQRLQFRRARLARGELRPLTAAFRSEVVRHSACERFGEIKAHKRDLDAAARGRLFELAGLGLGLDSWRAGWLSAAVIRVDPTSAQKSF